MLERATICPKYGARHTQSLSRNLTRSRRLLHSAFWAHGAGDIKLPSWWLEFLQRTSNERPLFLQRIAKTAKRYIPSILKSSFALDFLYPPKTLSLVHKLLAEDASASLRPSRSQSKVRHGLRHFTDVAPDKNPEDEQYTEKVDALAATYEEEADVDQHATTASEGYEAKEESSADLEDSSTEEEVGADLDQLAQRLTWYRRLWDQLQDLPEYKADVETLSEEKIDFLWDKLMELSSCASDLALGYARFLRTTVLPSDLEAWSPTDFARIIKASYLSSPPSTSIWVGDNVMARLMVSKFFQRALKRGQEISALQTILDLTLSFSDWGLADTALTDFHESGRTVSDFWTPLSTFDTEVLGQQIVMMSKTYTTAIAHQVEVDSPFMANYSTISEPLLTYAFKEFFSRSITIDFDPVMLWQVWNALSKTELRKDVYFSSAVKQLLSPEGTVSKLSLLTIQAYRTWEESRSSLNFEFDYRQVVELFRRLRHLHHPGARIVFEDLRERFGPPAMPVYRAMLKELAYHGETEKYSATLKDFTKHYNVRPLQPLLADLIRAYARRGDWIGAEMVFDSINLEYGLEPDASCWNAILGNHARLNGAPEVLKWFSKMEAYGVQPTVETNRIVLHSFCSRGETEAALALLDYVEKSGSPLDSSMITNLVFSHVQNGDLDAAEKLILDAVTDKIPGEKTRMWNIVLFGYAIRGHMDEVQNLHQRMLEEGIAEDSDTHAAILQVTSASKYPNLGLKIIREIMIPKGLLPSSFHFAIIIAGFLKTEEYARAFHVAREMKELRVAPDVGTKMLLIRAAVGQSMKDTESTEGFVNLEKVELDAAEKLLDYLLSSESLADLARHHPIMGRAQQPFHEVYAANYFETLLLIFGRTKALDKVSEFFDRYQALHTSRFPEYTDSTPIRIINALMIAHDQADDHAGVESCWNTAYAKATPLACRSNADTSQPGWVLHSRRFILHLPFYNYMRSLVKTGRASELEGLISDYQSAGYSLDSKAWNLYIRTLIIEGKQYETAFRLTEELLIGGFVGWPSWAGTHSPGYWLFKTNPTNRDLAAFGPHYKTLVVLAKGYMDFRGSLAFSGDKEERLRGVVEMAPRTVEAVMYMPRIDDYTQMKYLRGR
ncbi:hypothetical protein MMC10_002462 [Thelotrema lepadinum]|nr:hypothetical protein [Thelotrema lepadinum]